MTKYSKGTLQKLNLHLEKLKSATNSYRENYQNSKYKTFQQSRIFIKNRSVAKALLIESLFLNLEILDLKKKKPSLIRKTLLRNKKLFNSEQLYNTTYLTLEIDYFTKRLKSLYKQIKPNDLESSINKNLILKSLLTKAAKLAKIKNLIIKWNKKFEAFCFFIKDDVIGKWYIFFSRFLLLTIIHFIPFIQLCTRSFYSQPNKLIVNPITSYLFNFFPFLVPLMNMTMSVVNQDTVSFLILVPYMYFFVYSFKKYKISRKVAYQGTLALALMLYQYSLILTQEAITVCYKFTKRFFLLRKFQNIELLRDDFNFYINDLEELRRDKELYMQLGEKIFSLDDITKITKLTESTTIFSLLGVIALLYNCVYFILRGQKPIIPVLTKTVRRMMIDRKGTEFL